MSIRTSARIGAYATLGIAIAMAALALRGAVDPSASTPAPIRTEASADPLQARLAHCQLAGEAAGSDRDCLAAWAENRRRFLGLGRARPAEPAFSDTSNRVDPAASLAGPTANAAQAEER